MRTLSKQDTPHLSRQQVSQVSAQELRFERVMIWPYQGVSRFEFQLYCLGIPFVSQGVDPSHSASLQVSWTFTVIVFKDSRGVEIFRHCSQEPARLTTKQDTPHFSRQQVSQVSAQELQFERVMIWPYQGVSRFECQLYCLRILFASQGVVCFHSFSLQVSWTFTVIVFKDPRDVENFRHYSQEPARLTTKQDTPHLSRQQVSQVSDSICQSRCGLFS